MKALVTGAAGFIGSHVAEALLAQNIEVVAFDDLSGGERANVPAGAEFIEGSVLEHQKLAAVFREHRIDYIFHLAAYAAEGLSHFIRRFNYQNNLIGSVNLTNLAVLHEVKCLVFTSSIAVYGANQTPMREDLIPQPEDPYGIAKFAVEMDLRAAHEMFGLNSVVFRPHNVYGTRQNLADRYRNVIGIFLNQMMRGEAMTIFGDGSQVRAFSYIDDVAPLIAESIFHPECYNETFNIGSDEITSVKDLAILVGEVLDLAPKIIQEPARLEVQHAFSDHAKIRQFFGDRPTMPLREGLRIMAAWAREKGGSSPSTFGEIEIPRCLPPSWQRA